MEIKITGSTERLTIQCSGKNREVIQCMASALWEILCASRAKNVPDEQLLVLAIQLLMESRDAKRIVWSGREATTPNETTGMES